MEVRVLVLDPAEEGLDLGMAAQGISAGEGSFQLLVRESRVDEAVADGMDRLGVPAAAAARHGMVPFHTAAERAAAEEAGQFLSRSPKRHNV